MSKAPNPTPTPTTLSPPVVYTLPSWSQCSEKHDAGAQLTALEEFIYDNEPAGAADEEWRQHLRDVLSEVVNEDRDTRYGGVNVR